MNLISSESHVLRSWYIAFINSVMPEREVAVCSADEGHKPETAVQSSHLFSLGVTWYFYISIL